jgi:hypothetical protein
MGGLIQDIEVIALIPHGCPGGRVQIGIRGKAAPDGDRLDIPAIGLRRGVEPWLLKGAAAKKNRQYQQQPKEIRSVYSCVLFFIHSVFPIVPLVTVNVN